MPSDALERNLYEQIWQYIKNRYKNKRFEIREHLKNCLHIMVNPMSKDIIK